MVYFDEQYESVLRRTWGSVTIARRGREVLRRERFRHEDGGNDLHPEILTRHHGHIVLEEEMREVEREEEVRRGEGTLTSLASWMLAT